MIKTNPFEKYAAEYDAWYDRYPAVFRSEAEALRAALPAGDLRGIEVGLGTGRFSVALGIKEGIEPADAMRNIALDRGIEVLKAAAGHLPYKDLSFDFVLMAACINYFDELHPPFQEAHRVLKHNGTLIVGFIPKDSIIGKQYESQRHASKFFKQAIFYSAEKVAAEIKRAGFHSPQFTQTLFEELDDIHEFEPALAGYDKGSFVVAAAIKK